MRLLYYLNKKMKIIKGKLKNGQELLFGDVNIFVGPNGVGKTTLMNEIREFFCQGSSSTSYWVTSLENSNLESTDASILLKHIQERIETDDYGKETRKYSITHNKNSTGKYESSNNIEIYTEDVYHKLVSLSRNEKSEAGDIQLSKNHFTHRILIGYESTSDRLSLQGEWNTTDTEKPLTDIANIIINNREFEIHLREVFLRCFHYALFFSIHRRAKIEILVGKEKHESIIKSFNDKSSEEVEKSKKDARILTIDKVGDGMRAGAKLLFSLFNPESKIIFIDEPEVFIHPKQKINIARELKKLVEINKKQLFLSTHDVTLLSGLIDNKEDNVNINIFYLRDHQNIISPEKFLISDKKIKPTTKHQKYLQSLFHDGTIFTESPNDRCFYENTIEELFKNKIREKDIVFTDLFGAGTAVEVVEFVKDLKIKAAFIFDRDVISSEPNKQHRLPQIYKSLGGEKNLTEELSKLPKSYKKIIKELERYGIFIVPNGELQSWSTTKISKSSDGFPYNLIKEMISNPTKEFKSFVKKIIKFLIPVQKGDVSS